MAAPTLMPTSLSRAYPVVEYGRCNGGEGEALWIDPMDATEIERFNGRFGTDFDTTSMKDRSRFGDISLGLSYSRDLRSSARGGGGDLASVRVGGSRAAYSIALGPKGVLFVEVAVRLAISPASS